MNNPVITLQAARKPYAIPLASVRQVLPHCTPTPLPRPCGSVVAMLAWSGKIIPVLCLDAPVDHAPKSTPPSGMIIVCAGALGPFGVLCDAATGLLDLEPDHPDENSAADLHKPTRPQDDPHNATTSAQYELLHPAAIDPNRGLEDEA